MHFLERGNKI